MTSIVVLSRYPDIFEPLRVGLDRWEPATRKVLVTSGDAVFAAPGWTVIPGVEPFIFARNANAGIQACGSDDVLLLNDDVRVTGPVTAKLHSVAHSRPDIGILSPQIHGGVGNRMQSVSTRINNGLAFSTQILCFVGIYLKRSTIERVGLLDERFTGYGCDDDDYCLRVRRAGLRLAVTSAVVVQHGHGGAVASSSFHRVMNPAEQSRSMSEMRATFREKWGRA